MAPPAGRRKVVLKKDPAALPPGSVGRLNFVLAEAAFDAAGASEQEKANLAELKKQQFTLQRDPEAEARRLAAEHQRAQREEMTEEQRAKLEESRRRSQKRREKREAERKAAARREAQLQVYFRSVGKTAEAAPRADEPEVVELQPPSTAEQELPPILVGDALSLQGDLLAGLKEPSVLRRLRHIQRSLARRDPKGFASECQELVFKVQSEVLPKYGFSGDYEGIQNMLVALEHPSIHRDPDFVKNSASLNQLLFGCSFSKDGDRSSLFETDGPGAAEGESPRRAEREAGQARLAEECRRQWGRPGAREDRDAVGDYKSLAARFFSEEGDDAPRAEAGRREERSQLRLRREAASIIAGAGRRQAGRDGTGEDDEQRKFDGVWEDAEGTAVAIENGRMRGPRDTAMDFVIFDGAKCSLRLGDSVYEGRLAADGRLLWKDGSMWVRKAAGGDEGSAAPVLVAAGEGGEQQPAPGSGGGRGVAPGVTQALGGGVASGGQAATPTGGGGAGRGAPGGGTPGGGGGGPDRPGGGSGGPGGGGGGDPGDDEEDDWFEEAPPGRIFRQTLPIFHPPDDGAGNTRTIWKESGMPMIRSQFATGGERAQRRSCYSAAAAAAHGAGGWALVEALREDVRLAVADRSATRFVEAMETLDKLFPEERHLKREVNSILSSLDEKDRKAAKTFIVQAMPFREKEILEPGVEHYEVQSVFQEPSWYADWEVQPMWMWPLPIMFAMHQQCLMLKPTYTSQPHQWDFNQ